MKRTFLILCATTIMSSLIAQNSQVPVKGIKWYGHDSFLTEGTTFTDSVKENLYDRFPVSYKNKVREPVWNLSKCSAGISIRFLSNTSQISVKWEVLNDMKMNHMAETGIKGIDLYYWNGNNWQYVNTARPSGKINEFLLIANMKPEKREYKMYLPLYDGITSLEIGIDSSGIFEKSSRSSKKPVVFYGTSITQGGCASRPGMLHSSILSRKLDVDCINFGFSGNGRMEQPVNELISGIDAMLYVIECAENMSVEEIETNMIPLAERIRSRHPLTPIIFVDNLMYEKACLDETTMNSVIVKNEAMKRVFDKMKGQGFSDIYFIEKNGAIGTDHEATVDGVHLTDLGFLRYADFLIEKIHGFNLLLN
ncbi:MAG: SGNH/GDSL hydrolase family protein [Bacteroidales bacterium]|nr:SGNH/GDSL hydrolase family protein [Bacteroidales bacterium]